MSADNPNGSTSGFKVDGPAQNNLGMAEKISSLVRGVWRYITSPSDIPMILNFLLLLAIFYLGYVFALRNQLPPGAVFIASLPASLVGLVITAIRTVDKKNKGEDN